MDRQVHVTAEFVTAQFKESALRKNALVARGFDNGIASSLHCVS